MKVKVLMLAAFAFLAMNVNGQDLKFGAKAGLNMSSIGGDDADGFKSKMGIHIGAFAQYGINDALFLQPELLLSYEGAKNSDDDDKALSLTYLNIPVMVGYKIGAVEGLSLEVGPQLGFLMGAKYDGETDAGGGDKVKDYFKSTNFSLNLGAGYAVTENIGVGLRYCMGLTSISDDSDTDQKQSNLQISVSYKF